MSEHEKAIEAALSAHYRAIEGGYIRTARHMNEIVSAYFTTINAEPVAKVVSAHGDPEAFGERELVALRDIKTIPYNTLLFAAPPAPAEAKVDAVGEVVVKPLEWNPYRAETPFGWYEINDQRDVPDSELKGRPPFLLCGSRLNYSRHDTLDAARAAAQSDYEARIRSALLPSSNASEIERLREALTKVCNAIEREPVCGGDLDYPHGHNDWLGWRKKIMRPAAEAARSALSHKEGEKK